MSTRVTLAVEDDGQLLAVKTALDAVDAELLAAEAEAICMAAHPGIVELYDAGEGPEGFRLRTLWVGTRSVADLRQVLPARAASICAEVAETLAELHERGLVHGRVEASHALLHIDERPILCSLGLAGLAGEPDPSSGRLRRPADDVAGLGQVLHDLLSSATSDRAARRGSPARQVARQREDLLALAARATAGDPFARPTAVALAYALRDSAEHSSRQARRSSAPRRGRSGGRAAVAGALGMASIVAAVGAVAAREGPGPNHESKGADPVPTPTSPIPPTTLSERHGAEGAPVVTVGRHRYEVGEAGDEAVVGDWRCDGEQRIALLRPDTGAVFLFEPPLPSGEDASAPVARVEPGSELIRPLGSERCPGLAVIAPSGQRRAVPIPLPSTASDP